MKKDAQLTFRIRSDLKKDLEIIAVREGRSVERVFEAFLKVASDNYKKKGSGILKRFLGRHLS